MVLFLILTAVLAGLSLLPDQQAQKLKAVRLPVLKLKKRTAQGVLFGAVVLALGALRLYPFAFLTLLVGASVMGMSYWREKLLGEGLHDRPQNQGPQSKEKQGLRYGTRMSVGEAMAVLGLGEGAKVPDIDEAYRRLMGQLHPDKGGTDYLAAKINEAREVLKSSLNR